MTSLALKEESPDFVSQLEGWFDEVGTLLRLGQLAPYLGPGLAALAPNVAIPTSYEGLAEYIGKAVALPKRARGNAWSAAQFVESRKHRSTVTQLMSSAFAPPVTPSAFLEHLASLPLPLIVDTWYDGALRAAFQGRTDWLELQGINRVEIGEERWFRAYDAAGKDATLAETETTKTLLYKPHGSIAPARNFLITDADYVEVLTEIDIQNPIPPAVQTRRKEVGFLFLGCRFNDQLLRTYARQIVKRSRGPFFAVLGPNPTRMELRFLKERNIRAISLPLGEALERLVTASR